MPLAGQSKARILTWREDLSFLELWGPPSFLFNRYCGSFPGVQQLEHDVDYSTPSNTKVKNKWSYTFTPPICLHGMDRDNFSFSNVQFSVK